MTEKINESKSWFFEKANKIDKSLAKLIKKKKRGPRSTKTRNENGDIKNNTTETQRIIKDYREHDTAIK